MTSVDLVLFIPYLLDQPTGSSLERSLYKFFGTKLFFIEYHSTDDSTFWNIDTKLHFFLKFQPRKAGEKLTNNFINLQVFTIMSSLVRLYLEIFETYRKEPKG